MTQPQVAPAKQETVLTVPPPNMPVCTRVWSDDPFNLSGATIRWSINEPHPFVGDLMVLRMYILPGGAVEVYSTNATDKKSGEVGVRHIIPWSRVRLTEEAMDATTFIQEIVSAEEGEDEDEDDEDDDPDVVITPPTGALQPLPPAPGALPVNGQGGTS